MPHRPDRSPGAPGGPPDAETAAGYRVRAATFDDAAAIAEVHVASWRVAYDGLLDAAYLATRTVPLRTRQWQRILADRSSDHDGSDRGPSDDDQSDRGPSHHDQSDRGPSDHVLVLESDGTPIGFTHVGPADDSPSGPQDGTGEIYTLYLDPDHLGRGAGRILLGAAEARLAADGFDHACLWVLDTNQRARRFYERQGWSLTEGIRTQKYGDGQGSDLLYVRALTRPPSG